MNQMNKQTVLLDSVLIELKNQSGKRWMMAIIHSDRHTVFDQKIVTNEYGILLEWTNKSNVIEQVTIESSSTSIEEILNEINENGLLISEYKISDQIFERDSFTGDNFEPINYWIFKP